MANEGKAVKEILSTLTDEQNYAVNTLIAAILQYYGIEPEAPEDTVEHSDIRSMIGIEPEHGFNIRNFIGRYR